MHGLNTSTKTVAALAPSKTPDLALVEELDDYCLRT